MNGLRQVARRSLWAGVCAVAILATGCAGMSSGGSSSVPLTGGNEVPPVGGNSSGTTNIRASKSACTAPGSTPLSCPLVSGTVTTSGFVSTAAHIHRGKAGQNGPVIVPLKKTGDNSWEVPAYTYLTDSDYGAYLDGDLYVNVHSATNPGGEIRGQLKR